MRAVGAVNDIDSHLVPMPCRKSMQESIWDRCIEPRQNEWTTFTDSCILAEAAAHGIAVAGYRVVPPIYDEVWIERDRAHILHGSTSMESYPADSMDRLAILGEEYGEVCKEFNEARHDDRPVDMALLRKELIQTAAMATAWADAIPTDNHAT